MAQAVKAVPTQNFIQKTLDAQLLTGVTASVTLNNVTGIQNLPGVFIVDRVDTNGVETPSKRETVGYTAVSGVTLTTLSRGLAGSTDQDHAVGAIVEFTPDVVWAQSIYDAISQVVTPSTGLLDTSKVPSATGATLTGLTLNFGSGATGSILYEGSKSLNRLALGATNSFLIATGAQPEWYYASGASGSVLTSSGAGLPVYAPPSGTGVATDPIWDAKGDIVAGTGADAATKLTVGSNGQTLIADSTVSNGLKWTTLIGAKVYRSADTAALTNNTITKILFDSEDYDTGNAFASNKFTVPTGKGGYYFLHVSAYFYTSIVDQTFYDLYIYVNGVSKARGRLHASGTNAVVVNQSTVVKLVATDYVEFYALSASGNNLVKLYAGAPDSELTYAVVQQLTQD